MPALREKSTPEWSPLSAKDERRFARQMRAETKRLLHLLDRTQRSQRRTIFDLPVHKPTPKSFWPFGNSQNSVTRNAG
jgi:hypothetical protein